MEPCRPPLFRKRKFAPEVIVTCVRWYFGFCLSCAVLEELLAERGLTVDHTRIWRWAQRYGSEVHRRPQAEGHVKRRLRAMQGPRTAATAWAAIRGIEVAYMIKKGQVLGVTRWNLQAQAWLFGSLLRPA